MNSFTSNSQLSSIENRAEEKEEWPGYKFTQSSALLGKPVPLLIMELHRLQPFFENGFPRAHVLHMPHIKLHEIEVVGIIRKIYVRSRLDILVDDGTGTAQVLYTYENFEKAKEERKNIDAKFSRLEKIAKIKNLGPSRIKDLEKQWLQETKNGTLGKRFEIFKYIHVLGTIQLDFGYSNVNKNDATVENAKYGKPIIKAKMIYHLTEAEYNEKLQSWISGVVKNRYQIY